MEDSRVWIRSAACAGKPLSMFFPEDGVGTAAPAQKVCQECPAAAECLLDAVRLGDWEGIRGGWSGRKRRDYQRLLRQLAASNAIEETQHLLRFSRAELTVLRERMAA